ncbi:MAG TPA: hypothetical protein VES38_11690, partial [Methylotenera sp.]|nr:hypothetical protein [Methylotenera sp.]
FKLDNSYMSEINEPHKFVQSENDSNLFQVNELRQQRVLEPLKYMQHWYAYRFSFWKRVFVWPYLKGNGRAIKWKLLRPLPNITTVVWGSAHVDTKYASTNIIRMEDGFIHSLGLGSDLSPPCSQVLDTRGIYFDAQNNNDLFELLNTHVFDDEMLLRAANLRQLIVDAGITKYNLGRKYCTWQRPHNQRVILVIGQVSNDASVRLGASGAISSIDKLLEKVWQSNPDAMIVYKPHPDVLSGNRQGLINAKQYCHFVDSEADIISIIEQVDEVHTLSSLAGFDALIRNKKVVTYGLPFYSGWGLTEDKVASIPYRYRTVSLDALVAASLILYPIYWDWDLKKFSTPEAIVAKLAVSAGRPLTPMSQFKRFPLKAWRWCVNVVKFFYLQYFQFK